MTDQETTQVQHELVIFAENTFEYHWRSPNDPTRTACGMPIAEREHRFFSEPGDIIDPCEECRLTAGKWTNRELVEWIAEEVGFELEGDSPPSYLSHSQLVAIRDYILETQEATNQ